MIVKIQSISINGGWDDNPTIHDFEDCEEAMWFASALLAKPVELIRKRLSAQRSYTASGGSLFVTIQ